MLTPFPFAVARSSHAMYAIIYSDLKSKYTYICKLFISWKSVKSTSIPLRTFAVINTAVFYHNERCVFIDERVVCDDAI